MDSQYQLTTTSTPAPPRAPKLQPMKAPVDDGFGYQFQIKLPPSAYAINLE